MRIIFLGFFALLCANLFANELDTLKNSPVLLDEVVIRSFKYDAGLRTLPVSASAIDRLTIENQHITGVKDIGLFVPNLFMPDYGSKLTSPVYIRGIGSKINSPSVGLYVDGIPYFEKSAFDFDLNEIDYIEVLRGPQGTLFGRNTMGGLINIYTKSPLIYQETLLSASLGNYANRNATVAHYGKLNAVSGYAVAGNYNHSGGYFTNRYSGRTADESDSGSGRVRLDWRLKDNLILKLMSTLDYSDQGGYPYALVDPVTKQTGDVDYDDFSSYKRTISSTGATLTYVTNHFSLNSQTAFQYLSDEQGIDQDFSPSPVYFAIQNQTQSTVSQEINIKSTGKGRYKWLFGAFAFHQAIDNEVILNYKTQNYSTQKLYDIPTSGISFYHQSTLNDLFIERLSLLLGIRYDYEKSSNDYLAYKNTATQHDQTDEFFSKLKFGQLTPKIALQYTFPDLHTLYASVSKGYKTGGFNSSFEQDEDRSFDPEYSWNYEVGTKLQFFENRLRAEICLFYIDWKNQQIYQPLPSGRGQMLKNAGRSESKGAEVSLQAGIFNGFTLFANWGYTRAVFIEHKNDTLDYSGKFLPLVPSHTLVAGGDYQIPLTGKTIDRLSVNLNYTGAGRIHWNEDNAVSQDYYGQLNGKVSLTKGIATLSVWGRNLTDTNFTTYYFKTGGKEYAQKGKPFTIGASISFCLK
ncbi:MAG: TonB-dependent receptor [Candidatus Symbiothrix sp.]|jgi:outer membrane receptor protein involved in Fe transport|nr:TonB-dependent receptor [Candidatus Symbiothrix sp.]